MRRAGFTVSNVLIVVSLIDILMMNVNTMEITIEKIPTLINITSSNIVGEMNGTTTSSTDSTTSNTNTDSSDESIGFSTRTTSTTPTHSNESTTITIETTVVTDNSVLVDDSTDLVPMYDVTVDELVADVNRTLFSHLCGERNKEGNTSSVPFLTVSLNTTARYNFTVFVAGAANFTTSHNLTDRFGEFLVCILVDQVFRSLKDTEVGVNDLMSDVASLGDDDNLSYLAINNKSLKACEDSGQIFNKILPILPDIANNLTQDCIPSFTPYISEDLFEPCFPATSTPTVDDVRQSEKCIDDIYNVVRSFLNNCVELTSPEKINDTLSVGNIWGGNVITFHPLVTSLTIELSGIVLRPVHKFLHGLRVCVNAARSHGDSLEAERITQLDKLSVKIEYLLNLSNMDESVSYDTSLSPR